MNELFRNIEALNHNIGYIPCLEYAILLEMEKPSYFILSLGDNRWEKCKAIIEIPMMDFKLN